MFYFHLQFHSPCKALILSPCKASSFFRTKTPVMKQSFFFELSDALQGRSKIFRIIVTTSLILCALIFIECAVHLTEGEAATIKTKEAATEKKNSQFELSGSVTSQRE